MQHRLPDLLFPKGDWFSVAENQKAGMRREILSLPTNQILNTSVDDLCAYLVQKYAIDVPVLEEEGIHVDQHDTQIDVSRDQNRYISDRSQPFYISGTQVEVFVPFSGAAEAFQIQPTTWSTNPSRGTIRNNELVLQFMGTNLNGDQLRSAIQSTLQQIKVSLDRMRADAQGLMTQLAAEARHQVEQRRQKLLSDQNLVASLGFPLKRRADAPQTYRAPEVKRRVQLRPLSATTAPFKPEPALDMAEYEYILSVMTNMAVVMERSPSAFVAMGEEDLRTHFLVQLNGHYEGQATGETFNYGGKTDILIRSDGKNIFIAECKYWGGPKKLTETVDQLLGYTSWRDSKAAIVIFNRQRNFTHVLETIPVTMTEHRNVKRTLPQPSETSFRYILGQRDDPNREMIVTVLAFDVPHSEAARTATA